MSSKLSCGGGCSAKLGAGFLKKVLEEIPNKADQNLLVGFSGLDDGAVYKLTDNIAIVQTLDFFTPIAEDPYTFGKIAAANALSDIYAMGGEVKTALNIVCFPEKMDGEMLAEILKGGAEKVNEAGGIVCGGHSINDDQIKYGLAVTGIINPADVLSNNSCRTGDKLILTKPLGVGIITAAKKVGEASEAAYSKAVKSMEMLNKYAADKMKKYKIHACTDVTGFGFLGHLNEMTNNKCSIIVDLKHIPYIEEAYGYAEEFFITGAGQKNRKHLQGKVNLENTEFAMEEIMFDPQTSGGLLISVDSRDAENLLNDLREIEPKAQIVGEAVDKREFNIIAEGK